MSIPDPPAIVIVIPARHASSRFPGKPLALLAGRPLIQHVHAQAARVPGVTRVLVATDDARIYETVRNFGGCAMMITEPCRTGTDRVARAIRDIPCDVVVNLQADEVPASPDFVTDLIHPFVNSDAEMGTLSRPLATRDDLARPSLVKVVTDRRGRALYFSRSAIPHVRDGAPETSGPPETSEPPPFASLHVGVYIFRRDTVHRLAALPSGPLEDAEKLEQLRALEHGIPIHVWDTAWPSIRVDTPEDLRAANEAWTRRAHDGIGTGTGGQTMSARDTHE